MLVRRLPVGLLLANCYVLLDEATREAAIIDLGGDAEIIEHTIAQMQATVRLILLTHGHLDHSLAAGELQQAYPHASALVHEADIEQISSEVSVLAQLLYNLPEPEPFHPTSYLQDGQRLKMGNLEIIVIHTPGHTRGSVCFQVGSAVFTGDTLFAGGFGRTDLPGGSHDRLMASIRNSLLPLPDETIVYPGHGSETTIGDEKRTMRAASA